MKRPPLIVGLGEILWDILPSGRLLGGAPANFAYCSHLLGNRAVVASRIGSDDLGKEITQRLGRAGLADRFLQTDPLHATGTVNVQIDSSGQPNFEITCPAAWDFLEWDGELEAIAHSADAVCFGSLAQRSDKSSRTILSFLDATRTDAVRVFDVNLRQSFYSARIIEHSLERANVVKLNDQELPIISNLLGMPEPGFAESVLKKFNLRLVCITRGGEGSVLVDPTGAREHPGFRVRVKDTVGAGDAFTAGLVHEVLRGSSLDRISDTANRMGAWVASSSGAMPDVPEKGLIATLANLGHREQDKISTIPTT